MAEFRYLRASEWGITWAHQPATERQPDGEVYVHHTAGGRQSTDAAAAFRRINEMEQSRGYAAIGYDILVHRNTATGLVTIGEGRGPWRSAATLDRNEEGEAVCLLGYFHPGHKLSERPHPDEIEGVARAIVWGISQGWIARNTTIRGHRDNPEHPSATACPGNYLYEQLPTIRTRVAQLLAPAPTPTPDPPSTPSAPAGPPIGALDMAAIAHEANSQTFWFSPNGGLTRHAIRSPQHIRAILNAGAVDAVSGARLTSSNWTGATVLTVAQLNDYLGRAA